MYPQRPQSTHPSGPRGPYRPTGGSPAGGTGQYQSPGMSSNPRPFQPRGSPGQMNPPGQFSYPRAGPPGNQHRFGSSPGLRGSTPTQQSPYPKYPVSSHSPQYPGLPSQSPGSRVHSKSPNQRQVAPSQSPRQRFATPSHSPGQRFPPPQSPQQRFASSPQQSSSPRFSTPSQSPYQRFASPFQSPGQRFSTPSQSPHQRFPPPSQSPGQRFTTPSQSPGHQVSSPYPGSRFRTTPIQGHSPVSNSPGQNLQPSLYGSFPQGPTRRQTPPSSGNSTPSLSQLSGKPSWLVYSNEHNANFFFSPQDFTKPDLLLPLLVMPRPEI